MSIRFTVEDWDRIRENYGKWWNHALDRPLIKITLQDQAPCPVQTPLLTQSTCHRFDISAEDVIERIHFELEQQEYLGDAFPMVNFDVFGPGVVAAFLGAELDNSSGQVWFHDSRSLELTDMHFEFQSDNPWFLRICDIYRAGIRKWKGNVLMGMPDLGGVMDVLASLRGSENLLYDLYDEPDEVKRVSAEIQEVWLQYYRAFSEILQPVSPGYTDWSGLFSEEPSYVVQCDFSYMISPEMFHEFVLDDLTRLCNTLPHTLYHMDGKGELPHFPQLAAIRVLDAIQWCPGDGAPRTGEWPEVYRQIRETGKNIHVLGDMRDFRDIAKEIGSEGLYTGMTLPVSKREKAERFLAEFHC